MIFLKVLLFGPFANWWMPHLHSGPEHGESQRAPRYNPPPLQIESQLCSHTPPDAPECGRSALSLHTSVSSFQEDPETDYTAFRVYSILRVLQ